MRSVVAKVVTIVRETDESASAVSVTARCLLPRTRCVSWRHEGSLIVFVVCSDRQQATVCPRDSFQLHLLILGSHMVSERKKKREREKENRRRCRPPATTGRRHAGVGEWGPGEVFGVRRA